MVVSSMGTPCLETGVSRLCNKCELWQNDGILNSYVRGKKLSKTCDHCGALYRCKVYTNINESTPSNPHQSISVSSSSTSSSKSSLLINHRTRSSSQEHSSSNGRRIIFQSSPSSNTTSTDTNRNKIRRLRKRPVKKRPNHNNKKQSKTSINCSHKTFKKSKNNRSLHKSHESTMNNNTTSTSNRINDTPTTNLLRH